jgi:hypothetical protein
MLIAALAAVGVGAVCFSGAGPRGEAQSNPFLGASPKAMQFQPVNTSAALGNLSLQKMMPAAPKMSGPRNLASFFPKMPTFTMPTGAAPAPMIDPHKNPIQSVPANSKYLINPAPPKPGSKTLWSYAFNPLAKLIPGKK